MLVHPAHGIADLKLVPWLRLWPTQAAGGALSGTWLRTTEGSPLTRVRLEPRANKTWHLVAQESCTLPSTKGILLATLRERRFTTSDNTYLCGCWGEGFVVCLVNPKSQEAQRNPPAVTLYLCTLPPTKEEDFTDDSEQGQ